MVDFKYDMNIVKSMIWNNSDQDPYVGVIDHSGKEYVVIIADDRNYELYKKDDFERVYQSEKRRRNRKFRPRTEDVRKTSEFEEWVKKEYPAGTIFKMLGTRSSPWRRVIRYTKSEIVGGIVQGRMDLNKVYTENDIIDVTTNGIDKITGVIVNKKLESILDLYKRANQ